ncbi:methyltransferase domain protein [Oribacterium sp. oral taxon 078 str. F0262]|uniref:class I SAM-dependent methyltransferase n=1 Tax=Oribacterium sp. oral taxon 078 TaxID=652706 RepID=UPI0001CDEF3A|nr:class I SAM-dependent methyltransferase [Oribacterium sp. oral taxon 078]EFE91401.1 methyltransferase domain protein [Oribacterium sp. oral taxon 078 str. F0262]
MMNTEDSNKKSYNDTEIINYYTDFNAAGLFHYEEMLIEKYFKAGGRTLDIGCGAGRVTIPLHERGYKVTGVDYAEKMLVAAKTLNGAIDYRVGNILSTPFENQEFDNIIFSFNGLMLLNSYEERLSAVKEVCRLLKDDGKFIFTTPYLDNKVKKPYWSEKAETLGIDTDNMSWVQQMELGDEQLEDYGSEFYLHVPFVSEVEKMLEEAGMELLFSVRRLDYSGIEEMEEELDDNYLWVTKCKK